MQAVLIDEKNWDENQPSGREETSVARAKRWQYNT